MISSESKRAPRRVDVRRQPARDESSQSVPLGVVQSTAIGRHRRRRRNVEQIVPFLRRERFAKETARDVVIERYARARPPRQDVPIRDDFQHVHPRLHAAEGAVLLAASSRSVLRASLHCDAMPSDDRIDAGSGDEEGAYIVAKRRQLKTPPPRRAQDAPSRGIAACAASGAHLRNALDKAISINFPAAASIGRANHGSDARTKSAKRRRPFRCCFDILDALKQRLGSLEQFHRRVARLFQRRSVSPRRGKVERLGERAFGTRRLRLQLRLGARRRLGGAAS